VLEQARDPPRRLESTLDGCFSLFPAVVSPKQLLPSLKFRKTQSDSALDGSRSASKEKTTRSCLRRGRFSSVSLANDLKGEGCGRPSDASPSPDEPDSLPKKQPQDHENEDHDHHCDAGSVTFNEDGNRVVVFDSPKELWSHRGWSDYFAC
jgi:hypothetical protein